MEREIRKVRIDPDAPIGRAGKTTRGNIYAVGESLRTPQGVVGIEDFAPGDTVWWQFFHSETHYILKGSAEITYTLPPWYDEVKQMTVEAGDVYAIPQGACLQWKVTSSTPLRKLCIIMPGEAADLYQRVPMRSISFPRDYLPQPEVKFPF